MAINRLPDDMIAAVTALAADFPAALLLYLPCINLITFLVFGLDKHKARRNRRRIPEVSLFALCVLGGSIGALAGMQFWQHKTRRHGFRIGVPAILVTQLLLLFLTA